MLPAMRSKLTRPAAATRRLWMTAAATRRLSMTVAAMRRLSMTAASLLLAALAVSACTSTDVDVALQPFPTAGSAGPRFGDAKPMDFGPHHPSRYPVHGIDVSKYQTDIDWPQVRAAGIAFAFIKATEGGDRADSRYDGNWRGARGAGIPHAPYHFYYFCTRAAKQAQWFIANVPKASVQMPPVLDMEWNDASPSCRLRPDPATVRSEMKIYMDIVERHYGKRPIIYTTVDFHRENLDGHFRSHQFWLRSVAAHPSDIYPNHPWSFWQYTGTGVVPGVKGDTDINVFAGSAKVWRAWLDKHAH